MLDDIRREGDVSSRNCVVSSCYWDADPELDEFMVSLSLSVHPNKYIYIRTDTFIASLSNISVTCSKIANPNFVLCLFCF